MKGLLIELARRECVDRGGGSSSVLLPFGGKTSSASMSPLQDNFLCSSLSVACLPGYSNKTSCFISNYFSVFSAFFYHPWVAILFLYYLWRMICPTNVHFSFSIVIKMSSTLVCSLIHDALILSLHVMPSIILSISLRGSFFVAGFSWILGF